MTITLEFYIIGYLTFMNIIILIGFYSYFQCEIYNMKNDIHYLEYKNKELEKRIEQLECEPTLMF